MQSALDSVFNAEVVPLSYIAGLEKAIPDRYTIKGTIDYVSIVIPVIVIYHLVGSYR